MCFSFAAFIQLLIWAVAICAALLILKLLIGFVVPKLSGIPMVPEILNLFVQIIMIVVWAVVVIAVIVIVANIIGCLLSMAGGLPHLR